jgi:Protein of unknown function (DUF4241)
MTEINESEWEFAGVVGVDSGQVMIGDPCYLNSEWDPEPDRVVPDYEGVPEGNFSYSGACKATLGEKKYGQLNYRLGHAGAGVALSSGWGDGTYPVLIRRNEEGRIAEARIVFIDEEDDDEGL